MIKRVVAIGTLIALSTVGLISPAHALSGSEYNGTDPAKTGCNQNAYMIASRQLVAETGQPINAYMQVFYSRTCGTNWVRLTNNPYGGVSYKTINVGTAFSQVEVDYGYGDSYGMQAYAPGTTCITVSATVGAPGSNVILAKIAAQFC